MTAAELKNILAERRLTTGMLADLTGAERTTVWRWVNGKTRVPSHVCTILDQQYRLVALARQLVEMGIRPCVPPIR